MHKMSEKQLTRLIPANARVELPAKLRAPILNVASLPGATGE